MPETDISLVHISLQKLLQAGKDYPNSDLDFSVAYVSAAGVSLLRPLLKTSKRKRAVVGLCLINRVNAFLELQDFGVDRKSTRLNSSHQIISYAVFCLKKKKKTTWMYRVLGGSCLLWQQCVFGFDDRC